MLSFDEADIILALFSNNIEKVDIKKKTHHHKSTTHKSSIIKQEIIHDEDVPEAFRDHFSERYADLKHVVYDLKRTDFPKSDVHEIKKREIKVHHLEEKIKQPKYQKKVKQSVELTDLQQNVDELESLYHKLAYQKESSDKLESVRVRIHEAKKKILTLRNKKSE